MLVFAVVCLPHSFTGKSKTKQTSLLPLEGIRHVAKCSAVGIGEEAARVVLPRGQLDSAISL